MKKLILMTLLLSGCSRANMAGISAWGMPHTVKCYSGGFTIYEGDTTGKVENEENSDGYYFEDADTHKMVTVSGDCVIKVK